MSDDLGQRFIARVNSHSLPRALFMDLLTIALGAMRGERRAIPPDAERCLEDLPPNTLYLTDCPENQMGMSVISECNRRFPKNRMKAEDASFSFMFRWFALQKARINGSLKEFTKPGDEPGSELIHSAVFAVAADCPLAADGDFDESFCAKVRKLIAEEDDGG